MNSTGLNSSEACTRASVTLAWQVSVMTFQSIHYVPRLSGPYRTPDVRSCQHSCAIEELRYFRHETNYLSAWIARAGRPRHLKVCTGIGYFARVGRPCLPANLDGRSTRGS
ncbi:hypothetical protein GCM10009764_36720 [Nocardia ninae]|uniref:Uncharacterized protein n=1 Tax=Nocardia ninae NBRC 108245 TaxID=1210091 RepID=A0A511MQC3_9NOCA|nr:hypothetical protein NN4_72000 [Nocardia ninae NBRC 108245]